MTPEETLTHHARSFAPAARLLSREDHARVAQLYALCRTVDDLADTIGGAEVEARLTCLAIELRDGRGSDPIAVEARALFAGRPDGLAAFGRLVTTIAQDTGPNCLVDDEELDVYCMGVAGTVGVMICALFDVDPRWHSAAASLGKAMQLTNICRDVIEDARAGRRYLPATLCPHPPSAIVNGSPEVAQDVRLAVASLLTRADGLYRFGRSGLPALPPRLRLTVAAASGMYAGIGDELRARGCNPLAGRVFVPMHRKVGLFLSAVAVQMRSRSTLSQERRHAAT